MATAKTGRTTPKKQSSAGVPTEVTSASSWRKQTTEGTPLVVPSGNTCLVRKSSGLEMFIREGQVPNALLPIIQEAIEKGKAPKMDKMNIKDNPDLLKDIIALADNATIFMVIEPVVKPIPTDAKGNTIPLNQREEGDWLHVDEIDLEDKMFIFNWAVGGTADLEKFREELAGGVELVPGGQDL